MNFKSLSLPVTATADFCTEKNERTIFVLPTHKAWLRLKRYSGIGFLIAVGYMDPGNWATDLAAGSRFGYALLWVVVFSCIVAMLLQTLCVRLGVATGKDLAQLCREQFSPALNAVLWLLAQIAIIACDFAEVLGTALAIKLLFGLPLSIGIALTGLDTFVVLWLQEKGMVRVDAIVTAFVMLIALAFGIEILMSRPDPLQIARGLIPNRDIFHTPDMWPLVVGIIGATIMPHNLYLHSSAASRRKLLPDTSRQDAIRLLTWNTVLTLSLALLINAAILIVAASVFFASGHRNVTEINDAYDLLTPLLGTSFASIAFGCALFASGQSSTLTGTITGQIILQGFLQLDIPFWQQRLATRLLAIIPAWLGTAWYGENMLGPLLIDSQIILSLQLPFAMIPLLWFSSRRDIMGEYCLKKIWQYLFWCICAIIIGANIFLLWH